MSADSKLGLAIDPGKSSGVALFTWGKDEPFARTGAWQVTGGAEGLRDHLIKRDFHVGNGKAYYGRHALTTLVVEKFTPRPHASFNLTEDAVEPLRCEGMLLGLGLDRERITWRHPSAQYFIGSETGEAAKRVARAWLRERDLYLKGSDVGQKDGHDAMSATLHAISALRSIKHIPTLLHFFPPRADSPRR